MAAAPSDVMLIKLVNGRFLLFNYCITSKNISSPLVFSGKLLKITFLPYIIFMDESDIDQKDSLVIDCALINLDRELCLLQNFHHHLLNKIRQVILSSCYSVISEWNCTQSRCSIFTLNLICTSCRSRP